jgi:hypothetical protein
MPSKEGDVSGEAPDTAPEAGAAPGGDDEDEALPHGGVFAKRSHLVNFVNAWSQAG